MRLGLIFGSILLAGVAAAEEFAVDVDIRNVTVFPEGALIEQQAFIDIPGGVHQVILSLPTEAWADVPNVTLPAGDALRLVSVELGAGSSVPVAGPDSDAYLVRRAAFEEARDALAQFQQGDIALEADIASAEATLRAVDSLTGPQGQLIGAEGALDPALTMNMVKQLAAEAFTAQAKRDRAEAALAARDLDRGDLIRAFEIAEAALQETPRPIQDVGTIVLTIEAARRVAGALRLESFTPEAAWFPQYRLDLDYEEMAGDLSIDRQAVIFQDSGMDWTDARITLSTADPSAQTQVRLPRENVLRIFEVPEVSMMSSDMLAESSVAGLQQPVIEAVEVVTRGGVGGQLAAGEPVEYRLPDAVSVPSGDEGGVLVQIDRIDVPVTLFAEAVAQRSDAATLATEFTYDRGGVMLAGETSIYHNGRFVGSGRLPEIASGDDAKIGLGPLKAVLVKHRVLSREDGDRGLISSSNAREVRTETEIVNLLDHAVPLRLYDVLPVSESEDLRVTEVSDPRPDNRRVEGRRGVLEWTLELDAGDTEIIRFGYDLAWPKGFDIRSR